VGTRRATAGAPYGTTNKSIVGGANSRSGKIRLDVVADRTRNTLHAFICRHISDDAEAIYTDEFLSCRGIGDENTRQETVNHSENEWVHGDVHTGAVPVQWTGEH
jgi:hypothetical protein